MRQFMAIGRRKGLIGAALVVAILFAVTGTVVAGGSSEPKGSGTVVIQEAAPAQPRAEATSAAGMSVAEQLQNVFNSAANAALPVVVEVNVTEVVRQNAVNSVSPFEFFFGQTPGGQGQGQGQDLTRQGLGSGVIVARDGQTVYVLTNNHVAGSAKDIQVRLYNKQEYEAKLVGSDERMDLALVSFQAKAGEDIPVAVLGKSSELRVGDWVIAVGNPYGFESTVTAGIVSAVHRTADDASGAASSAGIAQLTDYIQTDASINSGNSGGALLNLRGEVVGINTWIASQTGGSIGIGFAIPIDNAKNAIKEFIEKGKITYGWLGVNILDVGSQTMPGVAQDLKVEGKPGSLVINVLKGSPAEKGGLLPGDYVVKAGETAITSTQQLTAQVAWLKPGTDLPLTVIRQGVEQKLTIHIAERPDAKAQTDQQASAWPGLIVIDMNDSVRSQMRAPETVKGLVLASVDQQSAAASAGLRDYDIVTEMNGAKIDNVADFYNRLNAAKGRDISFKVYRQGREATITFKE
jgi:serine protease Do